MKVIAEWWFYSKWEGMTEDDLWHFVMHADIVAQAYFGGLYKAEKLDEEKSKSSPIGVRIPNYCETILVDHAKRLNKLLCEMAKRGCWQSCRELWTQSLMLTETFSELALINPEPFKTLAKQSLFMPSVRARNQNFTGNAAEIIKAIELSADTVGSGLHDNRTQLGALTSKLVAECVNDIIRGRMAWKDLFTRHGWEVQWPTETQAKPYLAFRGKNIDEVLAGVPKGNFKNDGEGRVLAALRFFCMLENCGVDRIHFLLLAELSKGESRNWWKNAIEKMVEGKFPNLLSHPRWLKELKKITDNGSKSEMLRTLKKYCVSKVGQFANRPPPIE